MMSDKKFTRQEVKNIIKRATKLQNEDLKSGLESQEGITLEELQQIGADVGLSDKYLRAAALEYEDRDVITHSDSNETHNFEERNLTIEIDSNAWDELNSEMRHHFGTQYGEINEDPRRKEWTHLSYSGIETKMNITNRGNSTRLRLSQRVGLASPVTEAVIYGSGLAGLLSILGYRILELNLAAALLTFIALLVISVLGVYSLDTIWRQKKKKNLEQLADKLVNQLYESQKTDTKKKLRFETDVAEKHSEIEIDNALKDESQENSRQNQSKRSKS